MSQRDLIYKWISGKEAEQWRCKEINNVIKRLEEDGNKILKVGLQNYKSPDASFFMSKPLNIEIIKSISESNKNMGYHVCEQSNAQEIWCMPHYCKVIYEPTK